VNSLFENYGLVIINADDAILKKQFSHIIKQDISEQHSAKLTEQTNLTLENKGYMPDWRYNAEYSGTFYLKGQRKVISHGPYLSANFINNLDGRLTDREVDYAYGVQLRSTAEGYLGYAR
ncbi:MAG: bacillithiol biosynthesis BshC, partial [Cytophagaceae bacterium]